MMRSCSRFLVVGVLVSVLLVCHSALIAQPRVTASATPSNANPASGATITVGISISVAGTQHLLGSFTGSLDWNPAVLSYVSNSGLGAGFTGVVNTNNTGTGEIAFNGANPNGATGSSNVLTLTFYVAGARGASSTLDLAFTAMSAALTFTNLLPLLDVTDGNVTVGDNKVQARVECPAATAQGATISIPIFIDMTAIPSPDHRLGSFTGTLQWEPSVVRYSSNSGLKSSFTGVINTNNADNGQISFSGANPNGASGDVNILDVTFAVVGAAGSSTVMNLGFTAMSAAGTFRNLLPQVNVTDCTVSPNGESCDPSDCTGPTLFPAPRDATEVGKRITAGNGDTVYVDVRVQQNPTAIDAFGFTVKVDSSELHFVSAQPGNLTGSFVVVNGQENPAGSGRIVCGGFGLTPVPANSSGALIRLGFVAGCEAPDSSAIAVYGMTNDVVNLSACCNIFACVECMRNGDLDADGQLTPEEALCAFRIFLNGGALPAACDFSNTDCELIAADIDCDGQATPGDGLIIHKRYLEGLGPEECAGRANFARTSVGQEVRQLALRLTNIEPTAAAQKREAVLSLRVDRPAGISAFGLRLSYPADSYEFLGVQPSTLTAEWRQLEGKELQPGVIVIGGFNLEGLSISAPGDLFHVVFRAKGQETKLSGFQLTELVNDLSQAQVEGAGASAAESAVPQAFKLHQSFPNPLSARSGQKETVIRFDLAGTQDLKVELAIFNVTGQMVRRLVSGQRAPGSYHAAWDGKDDSGRSVPSGTYWYRLRVGDFVESKQLAIVR